MLKQKLLGLAIIALLMSNIVHAQSIKNHMSLGMKGGTTGVGGEFTVSLSEKLNARISGTFINYTYTGEADLEARVGYDLTNAITSVGIIADYFPFKNFLKLSVGVHYFDYEIDGFVAPIESYTVEGKEFSPQKLGSIAAIINYESKIVPYAGIGFGNSVRKGFPVRFTVDIGGLYTNSPKINAHGEGIIAPTAEQGKDFEEGLKDFKFYPVINFGLSIRIR